MFTFHLPRNETYKCGCDDVVQEDLADLKSCLLSRLRDLESLPEGLRGLELSAEDVALHSWNGSKVTVKQDLLLLQKLSKEACNIGIGIRDEDLIFTSMETNPINTSIAAANCIDLFTDNMYKDYTAVEELVDNCLEGAKGQEVPEIHLKLDQIKDVVVLEDNGIGVSYDSSSNIGDITSRGADTKAQGERRKQAAFKAAQILYPERWGVMRSGVLGNFGWGLKGATGYLLANGRKKGELRFVTKCKSNRYRTTWISKPGDELARSVTCNSRNGQTVEEFAKSSGTRIILDGVDPSKIWGKKDWTGQGVRFIDDLASRLAGTYDAYLHPVGELAGLVLGKVQALAGSEDKVTSRSPLFSTRTEAGKLAKKQMEKTLQLLKDSAQQQPRPERFKLTVELDYCDADGQPQHAERDCSSDEYKSQVYMRQAFQHAVSCLPLHFSVQTEDGAGEAAAGGTLQVYLAYVPKVAAGDEKLQAARRRAGLDIGSEQVQPLWEMKALSDPVDLGLLDKARANKEYKADFADLSMESIHGFMMVPKPFATSLSKAGLEEKELLKAVRRAISDGDAPEIVGRWVRQMLNDYERTSTISADCSTLTANGGLFKHGEVVSLQKKRRAKTSDELKPFEAAGAIFVLRGFQLDATHNDEAEDQVLCKLSPYHATKAADEAYLVPLRSFLLHKVAGPELQKLKESQWIAPASLVSATLHTGMYCPGPARSSSSSRRQSLSGSPESILVGDTCTDQYASVTDDMSGTRSGSSPNAQIAFDLLRKSRWSKAQFEVRQQQTAGYFCSPGYDLVRPPIQGKVAFGTVGNCQSPSGAWCFDAPGKYEVRLHLGQDTFASGNLQVRASAEQHAIEGAAATISSPWYSIEVEAPRLRHAESCKLVKPPSQIRRGVPTDLCLSFKRGSQTVCLTDSDVAGLNVSFNIKIAESVVATLEQSSAADGPDHIVKLKGLRFEAGLGPVSMKITVGSTDAAQLCLSCSCPCLVTVGLPTTILPGMQAQNLVNGSDCNALQPSVAFLDEQGGQVGADCDAVRPGLIGPLSGRPAFTYVDNEQCWQASLDTCRAESPLYSVTEDQCPSFHTEVIPVEVKVSTGNSVSAAPSDSSTAGSFPQIGMGLLEEDGNRVASVLCIGNAVQYSQRQGRTAMGIITGFQWGTNTVASGLHEVQRMRQQDVKLTLTGLRAVPGSPHHVTVVPEPKQPLTITASAVKQQLHVLSTAQAHAAFPGGCSNSRVGSAVLICDGLDGSEVSTVPTWECIGLLCVLLGSNGIPTSALCRFEQVIISPSTEPAAVLLSQEPVERLQVMIPEDVAGGLAGPDVGDQDEHGNLKLQGGAASQIGTVAALLLDEAGQPTAPAVDKRFTLKCSWQKSALQLLPDQSTYQLPAITLSRAYEPSAQTVVLKRNTTKLHTAELTAEPTPNGVSPQARLQMPAQLSTSVAQDQEEPHKPVISAGSRVEVVVALLGTEEEAAAWQNAPLQFSLSNVQLGLKPQSMVAAEVSTTTDADGQQHFTAAAVLPTQTCSLGDQCLLLTATAVYNPQLQNQMDTAEAASEVSTTDVRGELDVSLGRGVAATAEFLRPPSTVKELNEQRFTVQLKDVDGNLADLNPDSKLYLTFDDEHVKELTSANRDGLYTCKHDMQMLPETYDLAVTAEGSDLVMISDQGDLNVEVLAQDFVTGIKAAVMSGAEAEAGAFNQQHQLLDATQVLQGQEVAVLVQLETHKNCPLVVSKAGVRRHCKVRIGSSEFKLRDSTGFNDQDARQVVMHGVLPVTAGQHTLCASWTEERAALGEQMRKAKMLGQQELAWTKPVDANCMVEHLSQITVLAKPISKLQLQGEISPSIALSVGFKFPEQQWCLADDSGNQHSNINSFREARRCLQFKAAIVVPHQDMTLAAGSASSVPKFAVNQQSSYTWEANAVEEETACFSLPEEVLHLSEQPCGLINKHRLELRLTAERGLTKDLAPLRIPFMYSDRPAEVGDIQANQKIISDLLPEKVKRTEAVARAKKDSHAAEKALQGAKTKLSRSTPPVDGLEDVDAALEHVETQLRKVEEQIDQWQDGASFRVPRPEAGPLLPASLGKRIAFDLPYLTSDLGLQDTSDASPDQTQWTLGGLSGAEGSALVRSASACLQQQMAGMLCKTGEEVFRTLRQQHPRNVLLPIPAAVNVSNQLQDYFYQGASPKPDGLLGFLHEAFSILPQDTDVLRDSRLEVDDAAVRRGLSLWLEGALAFHTSKQALHFAQSRAIRGAHCPPILALDQPGGLLRLQGICLAGPTSATVPGEVDTVVEFGVLGYEDSRLAAQMDAQNDNLNEQREAITSYLAAVGKAKQAQEKLQQAEQELQTWLTKHEAELEKALQATGASSSNKRKAGTASQPVAKKRVRS